MRRDHTNVLALCVTVGAKTRKTLTAHGPPGANYLARLCVSLDMSEGFLWAETHFILFNLS